MYTRIGRFCQKAAAISDTGDVLTYAELQQLCCDITAKMTTRGLVFCMCGNSLGALVGYVACVYAHQPAVMLDGNKDTDSVLALQQVYRPRYMWVSEQRMGDFGDCSTIFSYSGYVLLEFETPKADYNPELQLLLTTSGSTGSPKLVRLTQKNLLSNAESIAEYLNITADERPITSLPMYYSYGLSVINSHLIKGATILLTDKGVMQKEFWAFAKEEKATSFAGVPYTYEMLRRLRIFRMDLPALTTFTQAGGKLKAELVKEFIEESRKVNKRFIVMYGQTEATARMSYLPEAVALEKYASIGIAIPGGQFALVAQDGSPILEPDTEGELVYTGANVSMGYAECAADLALGDENQGTLHTGDLAKRDTDGYYYITGRLKRFVKVWGNRCNLDAVEQICKTVTMNCACTGVDDKITIYVTEEDHNAAILEKLTAKTGFNMRAFEIRVIPDIPKNESGKVQYAELARLA